MTARDATVRGGLATSERRLRRLELTVIRRLDGLLRGDHLGLLPGHGSEPAGSREYRAGEDDVRRMDWAVTARTGTAHVRTTEADRELSTWVLVDGTPSMDFGTAALTKRELALIAVAAVGHLTARSGNRIGAHLLRAGDVRRFPARAGRAHLNALLRALMSGVPAGPGSPATAGARPGTGGHPGSRPGTGPSAASAGGGGGMSLADGIDGLRRGARRRGLAVVVSDFLDGVPAGPGAPGWERPMRRLAATHQVLAVDIADPRELELPDVGLITLTDPETGRVREISTGSRRLRARYAAAAAEQRAAIRDALRRAGAAHLPLRTDRDWITDIVRHVHAHRRLARATRPMPGVR
ncbi:MULTISPECIES: DUF58 domain-containing protein [Catenuloplanes]|uniref:Uncharacterized protein (DUF58 family) n=1 Tax=Catenuloplanes niger TaxID=587534 RepID=A0AAE3ZWP9_9ACTN|nr:DUF58 domain-containing protein [Catenuloplanes niger]MDR7327196.1 uncharacterized protein (DUF58 family) [Catenuloplanes niger]